LSPDSLLRLPTRPYAGELTHLCAGPHRRVRQIDCFVIRFPLLSRLVSCSPSTNLLDRKWDPSYDPAAFEACAHRAIALFRDAICSVGRARVATFGEQRAHRVKQYFMSELPDMGGDLCNSTTSGLSFRSLGLPGGLAVCDIWKSKCRRQSECAAGYICRLIRGESTWVALEI
jgi:hypothetical protein